MAQPFSKMAVSLRDFDFIRKFQELLVRTANFTRTQTRLPCSFMVGKKKHPSTARPRRGAAAGSAVNPGSLMAPYDVLRNSHRPISERRTFAAKQLKLAPGAATVSADSPVR